VEVAKVKKRARLTGVRNAKAAGKAVAKSKRKPSRGAAGKAAKKAKSVKAKVKSKNAASRRAPLKVVAGRRQKAPATPPAVRVDVKELDPQRMCGSGTSVQLLYRVDETVDGRATAHLVFFDRHGWYCEHGRNCPAVGHARKRNGHVARVS
jgi:hypothetical protein